MAFYRLWVQDVERSTWLMLYFHFMEEGEEKERKKISLG
jgi:hypothetical protein